MLDAILVGTDCTYKINDGYIVITPVQKGTVRKIEGTVKDTKGEPIIGATVMVKVLQQEQLPISMEIFLLMQQMVLTWKFLMWDTKVSKLRQSLENF